MPTFKGNLVCTITNSKLTGTLTSTGTISGGTITGAIIDLSTITTPTISAPKLTGIVTNTNTISGGTITAATLTACTIAGVYSPIIYSSLMAVSTSALNVVCTGITTLVGAALGIKDTLGGITQTQATWTIGNAAGKISVYVWKVTSSVDNTLIAATADVAVLAFGT